MTPRLLEFYEKELQFIREMGMEFSKRYPKIAAGLDLGSTECADPYVERLIEFCVSDGSDSVENGCRISALYPAFVGNCLSALPDTLAIHDDYRI